MLRQVVVSSCCALFCCSQPAVAGQFNLSEARIAELAQQPTWLKLLHFDRQSRQSEILTEDFFLSPAGQHDPKAELLADLAAYTAPWPKDGDSHARCRFPARYYWLSQQISLPGYSLTPPQCPTFAHWSLPDKVQSISLFLVSGYLGNPASVFGHSLLKLNTGAQDDQAGLFDLTVSYGALVPPDEPVWRYILRGLGGGYEAGFSDRYFYTQDLVYSRTEFRDIWDYELRLSETQRTLLVLHLWEVLGKKFTYYFLDKNCAFRLSELLELVIDEPLLRNARYWYVPTETFHRLEDIDQARAKEAAGQPGLIKAVRFIPSAQRKLYHQFSLLKPEEREAAQAVMQQGPTALPDQLARLKQDRQAEVLDTLLAYSNYRLTAEQPTPSPATKAMKNQLLPARFLLPPSTEPLKEVPALDSPAKGNRPLLTGIGLRHTERGSSLRLHGAAFVQEALGRNSLAGDELAVLETAVSLGDEFSLDQLDLLRIRKLKTDLIAADGENPWSWQLRTGLAQDDDDYDAVFAFGAGRAWQLHPQLTAYAMTDAAAHSLEPYLRLRPHLGLLAGTGDCKGRLLAGLESTDYQGNAQPFVSAAMQWELASQTALFIGIEQTESAAAISTELKWYW
jgi:hypothetical protein